MSEGNNYENIKGVNNNFGTQGNVYINHDTDRSGSEEINEVRKLIAQLKMELQKADIADTEAAEAVDVMASEIDQELQKSSPSYIYLL